MYAPPIIAPVNIGDMRRAVVAREERTVAPSAMGNQALFRGYMRDVQDNVAPMGRVHLVSMANIAARGHFMQELTTRTWVVARWRRSPDTGPSATHAATT